MKSYKTVGTLLKSEVLTSKSKTQTIIGIDPGLQNLGIGIIQVSDKIISPEIKKKKIIYHAEDRAKVIKGYTYMLLKIKQERTLEEKLYFIFETLCNIFEEYKPMLVVVEDAFVGINKNSALKLGLARGAILTAIGKNKLNLITISPKQIKMEITQRGDAQKEDIQEVFSKLLKKWPKDVPFDSSDALAAAFCAIK